LDIDRIGHWRWCGCIYYWVTTLTYSYAVYLGIACGDAGEVSPQVKNTAVWTRPLAGGALFSPQKADIMDTVINS